MPLVSEVCEYLDQLAPPELAEDWDNVGLLIGRRSSSVESVLTCLTLTPDVAAEALDGGCQMIVSHHPVLFRGAKRITDDSPEGKMLLQLIQSGIAVYSAHTRFDSAADGINQRLAQSLQLSDIQPIRPSDAIAGLGSGRFGQLAKPVPVTDFLNSVRAITGTNYLEYCADDASVVLVVAVACGSAAEFLSDAVAAGCDTFVTGEARFHSALEARTRGINLILSGHYASERPAMEWLAGQLDTAIPGLSARASQQESDPLRAWKL